MPRETLSVVGAALIRDGRVLVAQRGNGMALPGKWEFPGGKVEPGETPEDCLARELHEELEIQVAVGRHLGRGTADHGNTTIQLDVYACRLLQGEPAPHEHSQVRWLLPAELDALDWAEADIPVLPAVVAALSHGA